MTKTTDQIYTTKSSAIRGLKRKGLEKTHTVEERKDGGFCFVEIIKDTGNEKVTTKRTKAPIRNKIRLRMNPDTIGFKCWEKFSEIYSETKEPPTSIDAGLLAEANGWKKITCVTELADWKTFHGYVNKK